MRLKESDDKEKEHEEPQVKPFRHFLIGMGLVLGIALSSCQSEEKRHQAEADPAYKAATQAFLDGHWDEAIAKFDDYLKRNPTSPVSDEAVYFRGRAHLKKGNYARAARDLKYARDNASSRQTRAMATVGLGDNASSQENFPQARSFYKTAIKNYEKEIDSAQVLYNLGVTCQRMRLWGEAETYFERLVSQYPDSEYAPFAQRKVRFPEHFFTVQVGAFKSESSAQELGARLRQAGNLGEVSRWIDNRQEAWYYVRSGKFDTWDEAKRHMQVLKSAGFIGLVVP